MLLRRPFGLAMLLAALTFGVPYFSGAQEKKPDESVPATKIKKAEKADKETDDDDDKEKAPALDIGTKAPALAVTDWVKGKEIEEFKSGQIYVVEFWATWCGPCKMSMPHLAELQTKYGDKVKMIGVSDEETKEVQDFLKEDQSEGKTWDQVVTYSLVMDDERKTSKAYMQSAGENGIPTAFIIGKEGLIEWIGHPMRMDKALEEIAGGKWDRTVAKTERAEAKAAEVAMMNAQRKIGKAMQSGDIEGAVKVIDELIEKNPKATNLVMVKLQILGQGKDKEAAEKFADEVVTSKIWDDSMMLNQISWYIAAEKAMPGTLDTALKAAKRGVELTKEKDPMIIDTLARVYYEQGKLDEAITWQKKAVELSADNAEMGQTLKKYEGEKKDGRKEEKKEEKAKN